MSASPTVQAPARYLVLSMGSTQVLLDPSQVRDIEAAEQVETANAPPGGRGALTVGGQAFAVYDLTFNFELRTDAPLADRFCVLLADPEVSLAVLCEKVEMLEVTEILHPLPASMRLASSPVRALALQSETLLCQSTAAMLIASVQQLARPFERAATAAKKGAA